MLLGHVGNMFGRLLGLFWGPIRQSLGGSRKIADFVMNNWGTSHPGWPKKGLLGNSRFSKKT